MIESTPTLPGSHDTGKEKPFRIWRILSFQTIEIPELDCRGWWILFFPKSCIATGISLLIALDGEWVEDGVRVRGVRRTKRFTSITIGAFSLKFRFMGSRKNL